MLPADGISGLRIAVVAVDTLDFNRNAIHINDRIFHTDMTKSGLLPDYFFSGPDFQLIQIRNLRTPQGRRFDRNDKLFLSCDAADLTLLISYKNRHRLFVSYKIPGNLNFPLGKVLIQQTFDSQIPDMVLWAHQKINIAEDSGHPKLILILEVGAVAPFQNQDRKKVLSFSYIESNIKLAY